MFNKGKVGGIHHSYNELVWRGLLDVYDALHTGGDGGCLITLLEGSEDSPGVDGGAKGHHRHQEWRVAVAAEGSLTQERLFFLGCTDLLCLVLPLLSAEVELKLLAQSLGTDSP